MAEDLLQLMEQLNFGAPTSLIYNSLLTDGPLSADKLAGITCQPLQHLRQGLEALLNLQLIGEDYIRGGRRYYARDPSIAWLALEADLVWKIDNTLKPVRMVPSTGNANVDELRATCVNIIERAQRLYKPHLAALEHRERDAESKEEFTRLTCELIFQARNTIYGVSKSPRLPYVSQFWTVLTERINRGAHYHRIADFEEIVDHGLKVVTRDMYNYQIDLRILEASLISHSFYLVDGRYLAVSHQADQRPSEQRRGFGRITNKKAIVDRYRKRFLKYLKDSIPGYFAVSHLREAGKKILQRASSDFSGEEIEWIESLIDFGKFSTYQVRHNWPRSRVSKVEARALAAGLACRNADGYIVPVYPTDERTLRRSYRIQILNLAEPKD